MVVAPPTASRTTLRFPQRRRQRVEAAYRATYLCLLCVEYLYTYGQ
jgi:hypothetical protein